MRTSPALCFEKVVVETPRRPESSLAALRIDGAYELGRAGLIAAETAVGIGPGGESGSNGRRRRFSDWA